MYFIYSTNIPICMNFTQKFLSSVTLMLSLKYGYSQEYIYPLTPEEIEKERIEKLEIEKSEIERIIEEINKLEVINLEQKTTKTELQKEQTTNLERKFAILYAGSDEKNPKDAVDKNGTWNSTVRIYDSLLRAGYLPEYIYVLYYDGNPDWGSPEIQSIINQIKPEFDYTQNGGVYSVASIENFFNVEKKVGQEMDANDSLLIIFSSHIVLGIEELLSQIDRDARRRGLTDIDTISAKEISLMLNDNPSKNNVVILGCCYSQIIINKLNINGVIIGVSDTNHLSWVDKDYSSESFIVEGLNNPAYDVDGDGSVTLVEAANSVDLRKALGNPKIEFLQAQYNGVGTDTSRISFKPVIVKKTRVDSEK